MGLAAEEKYISVKSDSEQFPILTSHYDCTDPGHTRGVRDHFMYLLDLSVEDGDCTEAEASKEREAIKAYDYIVIEG